MPKQNKLFLDVLFICFSIPEISRGQKDKFIDSITISTLRFEKLMTVLPGSAQGLVEHLLQI